MTSTDLDSGRERHVVGNISLSLDGRTTGPGGAYDMGWIVPHAVTDGSRDRLLRLTANATTVLLGRKNYLGFSSFWPAVVDQEEADPRDRSFSRWLNELDKVVFSRTLTTLDWQNAHLADSDPASTFSSFALSRAPTFWCSPAPASYWSSSQPGSSTSSASRSAPRS